MDLNGTIYVAPGDSIPETLRGLFELAEDPREVQVQVGSREIRVTSDLLDRWVASREEAPTEEKREAEPDAERAPAEAEETNAPARKRAPRKAAAPAGEETA